MKALLIAFFSSFLMTWVSTTSQFYQDLSDTPDETPDEVRDFFRLLLLSRYGGQGAPDYPDIEEEKPVIDPYLYSSGAAKMVPFRQALQNYVDWKKGSFPYQQDQLNNRDQSIYESQHMKKNRQNNKEAIINSKTASSTEETTTKLQSSTTSGPDLLASMPPVTPNKGQKEYVMLRPPVDNHRKIEHWMQSMANGIFGMDHHLIQKRGSNQAAKNTN
ncbi:uncharacterized protein [Parasteatoda tepidariorum]|uniref:uncharacterized protein n=1 Tax=Parasteatoda tepidariorum TaxID=114398 RepID=UPI00077F9452|nr:uncharacterized protein LOC107453500 [Parasteatoda tepidariorum]